MAHAYLLQHMYSIPGDKESEKLYYARSVSTGEVNLEHLCELISGRASISSADVKAVLDSLIHFAVMEMRQGRIVRLGEMGNLRLSIGSNGVVEKKDFNATMIRPPHVLFTPGKKLRDFKKILEYVRVQKQLVTAETPCDKEHIFPSEAD